MKVSIIIPCYNQAHFLHESIQSALAQTHPDIEIIVVNDGSPDDTSRVVLQMIESVKNDITIILIEKPNGGLSSARNAGIAAATGTHILPLDADDKIHPDFITRTIGLDDIVSTGLHTFGRESRAWITDVDHPEYQHFIQRNHINCCSLFRKEIWTTIGGYDEDMRVGFEDWDFWTRATRAGYTVTVVREILFYYRKHSVSMFADAQRMRSEIIEYMHRKYSPSGRLIDVVYVLGRGSQTGDQELRYSLRSLERYCSGYRHVYIVGECPSWLRNVYHIRHADGPLKAINIMEKIRAACELSNLSDHFLFINDDHFFNKQVDIPDYPYYYSNSEYKKIMLDRLPDDYYYTICQETMSRFIGADFYDIHKPIIYHRDTFLRMCADIDFHSSSRGLLVKTTYCHYAGIHGKYSPDHMIRKCLSIADLETNTKDADVFSWNDGAICHNLVTFMEAKYPVKSKYER